MPYGEGGHPIKFECGGGNCFKGPIERNGKELSHGKVGINLNGEENPI